MYSVITFYGIT